jgi:hypothetical protein
MRTASLAGVEFVYNNHMSLFAGGRGGTPGFDDVPLYAPVGPTMVDLLDFSRRLNALSQAALECGQFLLDSNYDRDNVATILRGQIDAVILQLEGRPDTLPPAGATPPVPLPLAPRP